MITRAESDRATQGRVRPIYEFGETHLRQLHRLYQKEWWSKDRSLQETRRCVAGSQVCIGLVGAKGHLLAFARVITDFTFRAMIFDVIVSDSERGLGLGTQIIQLLKNHDKLRQVGTFELYCLPPLFDFYRKLGFSEDVGEVRLMRYVNL
jgi:GNAT superfamily N-acetyltransferase